uniref:Uncharacterized protein n=1 Tax=Anguilla anguilla TaxID=7936 RepID=A0A0E9QE60_ANGAN
MTLVVQAHSGIYG